MNANIAINTKNRTGLNCLAISFRIRSEASLAGKIVSRRHCKGQDVNMPTERRPKLIESRIRCSFSQGDHQTGEEDRIIEADEIADKGSGWVRSLRRR
jgi:hypothetical protein